MAKMLIWSLVVCGVAMLAYVRFAPSNPGRWHKAITATQEKTLKGGAIRVIPGSLASFQELSRIAGQTPRTQPLAGSVEDGMITFVTRSKWIGFPDYTTVQLTDGQIRMFARLRFGRMDMDVNKTRLERWIKALDGG